MQKRQFTKKKRRHDLSSPLQDLRENMKISSIRFWELFYLEFPPFFLFYQGKFVFPEQFLFICIKLKYLKFRRSPVGGKKWRLVGNWNPKSKKTKKKQKKDKSVSRFKTKRFILSVSTFFPILLSLVIFVLFKHTRAGPRFFFFCFFSLQHWRKPIINTFFAVSEPKYFLFFLRHGVVGRPKKKFVCVTNLVLELTMGVVRWNLNLGVLNLLVTENDWDSSLWFWHRISKTSNWAERFLIFSHETCLPVWKNKNTR